MLAHTLDHATRILPDARAGAGSPPRGPDAEPPGALITVTVLAPALIAAGLEALLPATGHRLRLGRPGELRQPEIALLDPAHVAVDEVARLPGSCARVLISDDPGLAGSPRARAWGASGVFHLGQPVEDLVEMLEAVAGRSAAPLFPPVLRQEDDRLTVREQEVLTGVCRGFSNAEIAIELYLSPNTVKTYVRSTYRKIGVTTRAQAAGWGFTHGYWDGSRGS